MDTVTVHYWPTESKECSSIQPLSLIITITLILSTCTTLMLCTSVWTDHWENMEWNLQEATTVLKTQNKSSKWLNRVKAEWLVNGTILQITINSERSPINNGDSLLILATMNQYNTNIKDMHPLIYQTKETATVLLAPMYGGIWTQCISLTDDQLLQLYQESKQKPGSVLPKCENYLVENESSEKEYYKPDWNHRMKNMSISCALVCIIIVVTALLIGLFSIFHRQISAMLITAVMFFLSATFGLFTLGIMYNKRHSRKTLSRNNCNRSLGFLDGMINTSENMCQTIHFWENLLTARIYSIGWSVNMGWMAVFLCILTSFLWVVLSKVMRQSPFK